jgi:hypothetical protein
MPVELWKYRIQFALAPMYADVGGGFLDIVYTPLLSVDIDVVEAFS